MLSKYSIPLLVIVVHFTVLTYKLNFIIGGNNKAVYYVQGQELSVPSGYSLVIMEYVPQSYRRQLQSFCYLLNKYFLSTCPSQTLFQVLTTVNESGRCSMLINLYSDEEGNKPICYMNMTSVDDKPYEGCLVHFEMFEGPSSRRVFYRPWQGHQISFSM